MTIPAPPRDPRDPRARRAGHHRVDPLDAAVRLEVAVDEMRAQQLDRGRELDVDVDVAHTAQLGTVEPPLTAAEFAAALEPGDPCGFCHGEDDAPGAVGCDWCAHLRDDAAPTVFSTERSLTWRSRHDEQSRLYGVRDRLTASAPIVDRMWAVGPVLDQGVEGACIGCGVAGATNVLRIAALIGHGAAPGMLDLEDAVDLYERAKELDEVPGESYTGTSVLAGLQAGVESRLFGGYLWAFGTRDIAQAVLQRGPVIVGVPWLSGMYETGPGGLVELAGEDTGVGHCLVVVGIRRTGPQGQPGPYFVWQNSWGPSYGDGGLGYVHHRDLATLLRGVGEAAIPTLEPQAATA